MGGELAGIDPSCLLWHINPHNFLKCNTIAAQNLEENITSVGMVLQDDVGEFIAGRTVVISGIQMVKEVESIGLLETMSWIHQMGLNMVHFEVDAKMPKK